MTDRQKAVARHLCKSVSNDRDIADFLKVDRNMVRSVREENTK